MIVLDTNVVSEPIKPAGRQVVQAWLDRQKAETMYLTSVSLAELLVGVQILPESKRKRALSESLSDTIDRLFEQRILPFDELSAIAYSKMVERMRGSGHTLSVGDAQIAAIVHRHGFALATRDGAPFAAAGITVVNP